MKDYSPDPKSPDQDIEKEYSKRVLRRLRIRLIIWLLSFIATIIWFSLSSNS